MPNLTTESTSTPTIPARKVSLAAAAGIAVVAAAVGSLTAIGVADFSATAGDRQLRSERSVRAGLADACMNRQVGWACGVTDVETFERGSELVLHVGRPSGGMWSHVTPASYTTAAAEVQRVAPLGVETVMFVDHDGNVL